VATDLKYVRIERQNDVTIITFTVADLLDEVTLAGTKAEMLGLVRDKTPAKLVLTPRF
jgi:hypothetical protein